MVEDSLDRVRNKANITPGKLRNDYGTTLSLSYPSLILSLSLHYPWDIARISQ